MRAVIQRVKRASVKAGEMEATIGPGLMVLVGLEEGDTEATCERAATKIASLRVFEDGDGKMNLGLSDIGGEILAISQFTLAGSIVKGRRPSFDRAMNPEAARILFRHFLELLKVQYAQVKSGFFQEHMEVELVNDGPVTFILER